MKHTKQELYEYLVIYLLDRRKEKEINFLSTMTHLFFVCYNDDTYKNMFTLYWFSGGFEDKDIFTIYSYDVFEHLAKKNISDVAAVDNIEIPNDVVDILNGVYDRLLRINTDIIEHNHFQLVQIINKYRFWREKQNRIFNLQRDYGDEFAKKEADKPFVLDYLYGEQFYRTDCIGYGQKLTVSNRCFDID